MERDTGSGTDAQVVSGAAERVVVFVFLRLFGGAFHDSMVIPVADLLLIYQCALWLPFFSSL